MTKRNSHTASKFEVDSLRELLESQDEQMQTLFAKAINMFVAPGTSEVLDREKLDQLRKAVDESLT